jgi:hypothetical protein
MRQYRNATPAEIVGEMSGYNVHDAYLGPAVVNTNYGDLGPYQSKPKTFKPSILLVASVLIIGGYFILK